MTKTSAMKVSRNPDLPDFSAPPLNEVVLGIQFDRIALQSVDIGLIWQLYRARYPKTQIQAALAPGFETFGTPAPFGTPSFTMILGAEAEARHWFISEDQNELIQLQGDRFLHNWRKQSPEAMYPRYENVRASFKNEVAVYEKYLSDEKKTALKVNQCELTYLNHIRLEGVLEPYRHIEKIFTNWKNEYSAKFPVPPERTQFSSAYVFPWDNGEETPFGRLHVSVTPAILNATTERVVQFNLTLKGKPKADTTVSAIEWLDKAHDVIVTSFTALTTVEMHKVWGKTNG